MYLLKGVEEIKQMSMQMLWTVFLRYNDPLLIYFCLSIYKRQQIQKEVLIRKKLMKTFLP